MIATCARVREILPAYLEREAGPAEALQAAAHIASCSCCADEARRGAAVLGFLKSGRAPAPTSDVATGVVAALKRMKPRSSDRRALKWSAVGLLGTLLAADLTRPRSLLGGPLHALQRAGEIVDLDVLAGRVLDSVAELLPARSSLVDMVGGGSAPALAGPHLSPGLAIALVFLGAAFVTALFAGSLLAGCLVISRVGSRPGRRLFRFF